MPAKTTSPLPGFQSRTARWREAALDSMQAVERSSSPGTTKHKKQVCQDLATADSEPFSGKSSPVRYQILEACYVAPALAYCHNLDVRRRGFLPPPKESTLAYPQVCKSSSPRLRLE